MQSVAQSFASKVKCPYCGYEADEAGFKLVKGPWRFRFYTVKMLECPRCHGVFNYYSGISPSGKRSEFVIRMKPKVAKGPRHGAIVRGRGKR